VALIAESFLPKVDGVSKTAFLTLRYLQRTGREVLVFAPDIAPQSIGTARVIPLPSLGLPMAPESRMALPNSLIAQELSAFKPDLIHMFSPALLSVSGMQVGRYNRIPIVANYQTDLPAYAAHYGFPFMSQVIRDWLRFIHNGCHVTLVPSQWTAQSLQRDGFRRLHRWGRGVSGHHFNPSRRTDAMRERLLNGRDPSSLVVIYVGRLANEKRIDLLLEVAKLDGIALTIIGDGALRDELESQFAGTNTHFIGYLFGDDLACAYASADIFAFTGAVETFGQVVQEAMASGLPSVVINQGGVVDLVDHGETGYVVAGEREAFANAVATLRDHPHLRLRMGHRARVIAESRPWEVILSQLEGHYREAIRLNERYNRVFTPIPNLLDRLRDKFYERVS
jgi:phosphatidylinositol alpha 1,6-mannosyltransferase